MYKKFKYFIPAIIWMIFIFIMSHTVGTVSSQQSSFIADIITQYLKIDYSLLTFIIRKTAHMSEYAVLLLLLHFGITKIYTHKYSLLISLFVTFIYACSDEIHQLFIPGRSGQFTDVLIDTSGALIMLLIIYSYKLIKRK